jgi:hypothetical protein
MGIYQLAARFLTWWLSSSTPHQRDIEVAGVGATAHSGLLGEYDIEHEAWPDRAEKAASKLTTTVDAGGYEQANNYDLMKHVPIHAQKVFLCQR